MAVKAKSGTKWNRARRDVLSPGDRRLDGASVPGSYRFLPDVCSAQAGQTTQGGRPGKLPAPCCLPEEIPLTLDDRQPAAVALAVRPQTQAGPLHPRVTQRPSSPGKPRRQGEGEAPAGVYPLYRARDGLPVGAVVHPLLINAARPCRHACGDQRSCRTSAGATTNSPSTSTQTASSQQPSPCRTRPRHLNSVPNRRRVRLPPNRCNSVQRGTCLLSGGPCQHT